MKCGCLRLNGILNYQFKILIIYCNEKIMIIDNLIYNITLYIKIWMRM